MRQTFLPAGSIGVFRAARMRGFHHIGPIMLKIYHNPRCSKSRAALALVEAHGHQENVPVEVVEYLKHPPSLEELAQLQALLGGARAMVRDNEERYAALQLEQADDRTLLDALVRHPELLQRPIVLYRGRALVARPPELLTSFLAGQS